MSKHNETGVKGEQIAEKFLLEKGYIVLYKNWCAGKKEIDIVAQKADILVFVEVKTRSSIHFAYPEESVDFQKQNYLRSAAEAFLESNPGHIKVQFDVISIHLGGETVKEIVHFEDAF